jgi:MOSC domain-containing protein YiiM
MNEATVEGLIIGSEEAGPVDYQESVVAVAGAGLKGDRYFDEGQTDPTREVTVIGIEGIEEAAEESGIDITPLDIRRNIITRGVPVRDLIGKTFWVGEVQLEGLKDNPACAYLQRLVGKQLLKPMVNRGGIRARIVRGGTINKGDPIRIDA